MGIYYSHIFSSTFSNENIKNTKEKFVVINNFEVGGKNLFTKYFCAFQLQCFCADFCKSWLSNFDFLQIEV